MQWTWQEFRAQPRWYVNAIARRIRAQRDAERREIEGIRNSARR